MMQIVEQSDEQKAEMYAKLSKEELIHMVIALNKYLAARGPIIINSPTYPVYPVNPFWQIPVCPISPTCLPKGQDIIYTTSTGT